MSRRKIILLAAVILVVLVGFGVYSTYLQPRERQLKPIKVGHGIFVSYAPVWLAQEKGFFREEGLNVTFRKYVAVDLAQKGLVAGEVEILHSSLGAAFYNSILKGLDLKILAGEWTVRGGVASDNSLSLIVRKDLYEAGVRDLKGFVGKKLGTGPKGGPGDIMLLYAAKAENIPYLQFDPIRSRADLAASAMEAKAIDAFIWGEPFMTLMLEKGYVAIKRDTDVYPHGSVRQFSGVVSTGMFIQENQELVKAYLKAYQKGVDYYLKGLEEGATGSIRNEIAGIVEKYIGLPKDTTVKARWSVVLPGAIIDTKGIVALQTDFVELGVQDGIVPADKLVVLGISLQPP